MNKAKLYSKYNGLQKNDAKHVIENYLRLLTFTKNEQILDVGCGDGEVLNEFLLPNLPDFSRVIGVDISNDMVQFARETYPKLKYEVMDIATNSLPVEFEENFDHIFSFYCLHWVVDQKKTFENMAKMLKPGGEILLTFLASNPIYDVYERMAKMKWGQYMSDLEKYISPYHHATKPDEELQRILRENAFSTHLCRVEKRFYVFPSFSVLETVNPFISSIPEDLREDYTSDYFKEVRKLESVEIEPCNNNNEEKIKVPYKLFIVFASKRTS